jgi:hypothetical protein
MSKGFKRFNLNYSFWVKLTPLGWEQYKLTHERYLPTEYHKDLAEYQKEVNEQGYVEIQAWRFLQAFGAECSSLGNSTLYYEMDILLAGKDLLALRS